MYIHIRAGAATASLGPDVHTQRRGVGKALEFCPYIAVPFRLDAHDAWPKRLWIPGLGFGVEALGSLGKYRV